MVKKQRFVGEAVVFFGCRSRRHFRKFKNIFFKKSTCSVRSAFLFLYSILFQFFTEAEILRSRVDLDIDKQFIAVVF